MMIDSIPSRQTRERFIAWWNHACIGRPMMSVVVQREEPTEALEPVIDPATPEALHLDVARKTVEMRNRLRTRDFRAESFPSLSVDIGPGSIATYLGSEPVFAWDTVWFQECVKDWDSFGPLVFDPTRPWWRRHVDLIRQAQEAAQGRYLVNIPDLIENVDILSALRGPQEFCMDMIDEPDKVEFLVERIDEVYFEFYDRMYEIVKAADGSSSYTAFEIWGPGRVAKIQCDFCALMSPTQFRRFVQPSLRKQCRRLENSIYHLDGPDAIKHLDALMEIEELDALQWTSGAAKPDGGWDGWYPIYDKVRKAGKSLWISVYDGAPADWIERCDRLVDRYGPNGLYLLFPTMTDMQADALIGHAEMHWKP